MESSTIGGADIKGVTSTLLPNALPIKYNNKRLKVHNHQKEGRRQLFKTENCSVGKQNIDLTQVSHIDQIASKQIKHDYVPFIIKEMAD